MSQDINVENPEREKTRDSTNSELNHYGRKNARDSLRQQPSGQLQLSHSYTLVTKETTHYNLFTTIMTIS